MICAEAALKGEAFSAAIEAATKAFELTQKIIERVLPAPDRTLGSSNEDLAGLGGYLTEYLASVRNLVFASVLRVDLREFGRFVLLAPNVSRTQSGQWRVVLRKPISNSKEDAEFAVRFMRDFALAVQREVG